MEVGIGGVVRDEEHDSKQQSGRLGVVAPAEPPIAAAASRTGRAARAGRAQQMSGYGCGE